jgi:hypothetical protein
LEFAVLCAKSQRVHGFLYPLSIGDEVNFRLTYDGPLKAASQSDTRRILKHEIRCIFSRQLEELYNGKNATFLDAEMEIENVAERLAARKPMIRRRGNLSFLALVREEINLVCDLDILFLRREEPGHLINSGGDLDNRLKVLFDALRIPQDENEVRGLAATEHFILCLTEDDRLITGFRVTTDRLLEPAKSEAEKNHVRLIINVEVKATKLTPENMAYFSHF